MFWHRSVAPTRNPLRNEAPGFAGRLALLFPAMTELPIALRDVGAAAATARTARCRAIALAATRRAAQPAFAAAAQLVTTDVRLAAIARASALAGRANVARALIAARAAHATVLVFAK